MVFYGAIAAASYAASKNLSESNNNSSEKNELTRDESLLMSSLLISFCSFLPSLLWVLGEREMFVFDFFCGPTVAIFAFSFILALFVSDEKKAETAKKAEIEEKLSIAGYLCVIAIVALIVGSFILSLFRGLTLYSISTGIVVLYWTIWLAINYVKEKTLAKN